MSHLIHWDPFRNWLRGGMDDSLPDLWRRELERNGEGVWKPRADVVETPEAYVVKVEMPGMKSEDVNVTLTGDTLTLKGERNSETQKDEDHWHVVERVSGSFVRTFKMPTAIDASGVDAEMKDGVLTVTVRKAPEVSSARIEVKTK